MNGPSSSQSQNGPSPPRGKGAAMPQGSQKDIPMLRIQAGTPVQGPPSVSAAARNTPLSGVGLAQVEEEKSTMSSSSSCSKLTSGQSSSTLQGHEYREQVNHANLPPKPVFQAPSIPRPHSLQYPALGNMAVGRFSKLTDIRSGEQHFLFFLLLLSQNINNNN